MKLSIWLLAAGALVSVAVLGAESASAQISNTFTTTGPKDCLVSGQPFNSQFQAPVGASVAASTANNIGTITFNPDGTGSVTENLIVGIISPVPPIPLGGSTSSSGRSGTATWSFTYTVSNGIATITMTPGSYLETISTGPRAGQTATLVPFAPYLYAYLSVNRKNLFAISAGTGVEKETYLNRDVRYLVCSQSFQGSVMPGQ